MPAHPSGFYPATRAMTMEEYHAGYSPDSPQGSVFLDILDKKGVEVASGLSVVIMNYMDAVLSLIHIWPNVHKTWTPTLCMHCENPPCCLLYTSSPAARRSRR